MKLLSDDKNRSILGAMKYHWPEFAGLAFAIVLYFVFMHHGPMDRNKSSMLLLLSVWPIISLGRLIYSICRNRFL
jgi:hypothetical protein